MPLLDTLTADLKTAMKARDSARVGCVRLLINEVKNAAIAKGEPLDEAGELQLLSSQAKRRRESIEAYRKGGRDDLAESEAAELVVIEGYLPAPLDAAEVTVIVEAAIAETGAAGMRDMGKVMGRVMPQVRGRFPGKDVKPIVMARLEAGS